MINIFNIRGIWIVPILICISFYSLAARDFSKVEIKAKQVRSDVYMLSGPGGNIGVLATNEGLVMVDDKFAPLAEKIEATMKQIKNVPLKYVINTHYHGDHTGSNAHFAEQAPIFAHHNVRKRVMEDNGKSGADLPVVTYEQGVKIYIGNEEVELIHKGQGHTDGDSIVFFKQANVIHMGDLMFQGRFPYIDLNAGGSVMGYLKHVKQIHASLPKDVLIIPGHGDITDTKGLSDFIDMMEHSVSRVNAALKAGKSEEQILKEGIGEAYKSWSWNFITEEKWLKTLISDLK